MATVIKRGAQLNVRWCTKTMTGVLKLKLNNKDEGRFLWVVYDFAFSHAS